VLLSFFFCLAVFAEHEECRALIADLLSYGVSAEYLVEYGIDPKEVAQSLFEIGYPVPVHLHRYLQMSSSLPHALHFPPRLPFSESMQQHHPPQPLPPFPPPPPRPTLRIPEMPHEAPGLDLERRHREALLARKAALASRNAARAEIFFANELGDLLSAKDASSKGKERSVDEEMSDYSSSDVVMTPASGSTAPTPLPGGRRPVAADFESEPSSAVATTPNSSISALANGRFRPDNRPKRLVVDISDSEDDDGDGKANGRAVKGQGGGPSGRSTPVPVAELEAKEAEIKRMMEKIAQMEKRKSKAPVLAGTGAEAVSRASTPSAGVTATSAELRVAKDEMEKLEDERREIIASATAPPTASITKDEFEETTAKISPLSRSPSIASTSTCVQATTLTASSSFVSTSTSDPNPTTTSDLVSAKPEHHQHSYPTVVRSPPVGIWTKCSQESVNA
jgi:hypothetical protein